MQKFTIACLSLFLVSLFIQTGSAQVGKIESALLAEVKYANDCSPEHQAFNDKMMMFGRIVVSTRAFEEAVRSKVTSLYRKCKGDPFYNESMEYQIRKVIEIARSMNDVHIKCSGGSGNASASLGHYGKLSDENFSWGSWFGSVYDQLDRRVCNLPSGERPDTHNCRWEAYPWPYSQGAGIIWHEVMHQHGYTHGANDQPNAIVECGYSGDPSWNYQVNTMPYIIGNCISEVINQSAQNCNLDACPGSNQLQIVTQYNGTQCNCVSDPAQSGIGILKVQSNALVEEAIKPYDEWIGGWHLGEGNKIQEKGDFNGDGKDDFIITSGWGIGIFTYVGKIWKPLVVKPNGTRFGGWNFDSKSNFIIGTGDFNGDNKDDIVITSNWGIGILTLQGNSLNSLMLKPNDTWLGQWRYNAKVNSGKDIIRGIGDFDGDNTDEILITSTWGIGILKLSGSTLISPVAKPNGTRFGGWNFNSKDNYIPGVGNFNGDAKDDILIASGWGIGILTMQGNSLNSLMLQPNDTWFGQWRYNAKVNSGKDLIQGIGDFNGDGSDDILITSKWGVGILKLSGTSMTSIVAKPNGTRFGGWNFDSGKSKFKSVGDYDGDGKDDMVVKSDWGIGVLKLSGNTLLSIDLQPYGKLFGSWINEKTDLIAFSGKFDHPSTSRLLLIKQ